MIDIKDNTGKVLYSTPINKGSKRKFELMKDDYIMLKFTLDNPVDFPLGTYAECDFGRFEVVEDQTGTFSNTSGGYDYELKLGADYMKWRNKLFKYQPEVVGGNEASWSLTAPLATHMGIFLRCLKAWGYKHGGMEYQYFIDDTVTTENLFLTYSNTNLIDALTMMAEAAGCEWWVDGADIHFGRMADGGDPVTLELGANAVSMTLSKSSGDYFTRIYAFGSTNNISPRYRKKLEFTVADGGWYDTVDGERCIAVVPDKKLEYGYFRDGACSSLNASKDFSPTDAIGLEGNKHNGGYVQNGYLFIQNTWGTAPVNIDVSKLVITFNPTSLPCTFHTLRIGFDLDSVMNGTAEEFELDGSMRQISLRYKYENVFTGGNLTLYYRAIYGKYDAPISISASLILSGSIKVETVYKRADVTITMEDGTQCDAVFDPFYKGESELSVKNGDIHHSYFDEGKKFTLSDIVRSRVPIGYFESDVDGLTVNGVVQRRLMLPEGIPYVDLYEDMHPDEVIEGVVVFDHIYPGKTLTVSAVDDPVWTDVMEEYTDEDGETQERPTGIKVPTYTIRTTELAGFSQDYVIGESLTVTFQTGSLAGLSFGVSFLPDKSTDTEAAFQIVANEDYGGRLPDEIMKPSAGDSTHEADTFVMAGYDTEYMFNDLTAEAEQRLYQETLKYKEKLLGNRGTVTASLFSDWSRDKCATDGTIHPIKAGGSVVIDNKALFPTPVTMRVIGYELNLDIPYDTPQYTIGESPSYSRLGALESKIDSVSLNGSSYMAGGTSSSAGGTSIKLIRTNDRTAPSDTNAYSAARTDKEIGEGVQEAKDYTDGKVEGLDGRYLSKVKEDRTWFPLHLGGGADFGSYMAGLLGGKIDATGAAELLSLILRTGLESDNFSTGALGAGFCLKKDENGDAYIEVDRMLVRKIATFVQLMIQELKHVGGQIVLTPASMKCSRVVAVKGNVLTDADGEILFDSNGEVLTDNTDGGEVQFYRCYFEATDGEKTINNEFAVGDQARCQTFNVKEGLNTNVSNTYYWRLVTGVGDDYIDLSATDCDAGSTAPAAGDEIVQLGHRTDATRQAAVILSAYGEDAPYIKMYRGISGYSLDGKEFFTASRTTVDITADTIRFRTGQSVEDAMAEIAEEAVKGVSETVDGLVEAAQGNVKGVDVEYALGDSPEEAPEEGWQTASPQWTEGKYVWQRTATTLVSGKVVYSEPVCIQGASGRGVAETDVSYQAGSSGTTPPDGNWSASVPSVPEGQYLWTRTVISYNDGTTSTSFSVGKMGADGDGIVSVSTTYQIGSSGTTPPTGSWSASVPSPQKGKYLWTRTVTSYKQGDPTTTFGVSYYGTDGAAAKYVRLAGDQTFVYSNNFSGNPTPASIKLTATLTGTSGYQWSYKRASQSGFTNISGATSQTYTLSHDNSAVWGGEKSVTLRCTSGGVHDEMTVVKVSSGKNGTDGKDAYTVILTNESHSFQGNTNAAIAATAKCGVIAYKGASRVAATIGSVTGMPTGMTVSLSGNGTTGAAFTVAVTASLTTGQGTLTVPVTVDGKQFTKNFSFSVAFKGDKGDTGPQGVPGEKGEDGKAYYTWVRYADNANGGGISNDPTGKEYIGFAYNKASATESNTPSDYTWSKIKGEKGDQGVPGEKGEDGTQYWTWIKYSDNANGNPMYDEPKDTTKYIGIAPNRTSPDESGQPGDYTWSRFKGKGVSKITEQYYLSASSSTPTGGSWTYARPEWVKGKYVWTRSEVKWDDGTTTYTDPVLAGDINGLGERAEQAIADAANAKAEAEAAQKDATEAKNRLDEWAADGVISPVEKQGIKDEMARIDADKEQIADGYAEYSLGTPSAYNTSYANYRERLAALSASSPDTIAIPSDFASRQDAYYANRASCLNAIAVAAKGYAEQVVAALEVGGTNLLMMTNQGTTNWHIGSSESGTVSMAAWGDGVEFKVTRKPTGWGAVVTYGMTGTLPLLEPDTEYRLSFDAWCDKSVSRNASIRLSNGNGMLSTGSPSFNLTAGATVHVELKLFTNGLEEMSSQVLYLAGFGNDVATYRFKNLKLEKGNKATAWSPAPQDLTPKATFEVLEGRVESLAKQLEWDPDTGTTKYETKFEQTAKEITSLATKTDSLGTRVSSVEQTAEGITSTVSGLNGRVSTIEQTAEDISLKVASIDPVNLFRDGSFERGENSFEDDGAGLFYKEGIAYPYAADKKFGKMSLRVNADGQNVTLGIAQAVQKIPVEAGAKYTLVTWKKANKNDLASYVNVQFFDSSDNNIGGVYSDNYATTSWASSKKVATAPSGAAYAKLRFQASGSSATDYCLFDGIMFLKGDWTGLDRYIDNNSLSAESLLETGIDIENKKVTVTADRFEVRNNAGDVTARVNENGLLQVGSGEFSGLIRQVPFLVENAANDDRLTLDGQNYIELKEENLVTGGFIVINQTDNKYVGQGINLPVGFRYAGTRIFIIKRWASLGNFTIRTVPEDLPDGYTEWREQSAVSGGELFRIRNKTASAIWMGDSGSWDNEFVELVAMPKSVDIESGGRKAYGHVEWVVMNAWQWAVKSSGGRNVGYRQNGY